MKYQKALGDPATKSGDFKICNIDCRDANNLAISRIHTWPADAS